MHFLESKLLILLGYQLHITELMLSFIPTIKDPLVIEFFLKESVLYDGLNILSEVDGTV